MDPEKRKKIYLLIAALLGFLLLLWPAMGKEKTSVSTNSLPVTETGEDNLEGRLKKLLVSTEGVGKAEVMITLKQEEETSMEVEGVVVLCDGGGNAKVKSEIAEAVGALFDVPAHKIKVLKRVSGKS
ncbi:MAG: hypothetical protein IKU83_02915 [Lachnospiraceae bacterium]|nr:hypothetical protein [Lachnospiraceae bacterium]